MKTKSKVIFKIEDVSIVADRHAKDIDQVNSGLIALDFTSEKDCHTVAKLANLEHYNILKDTVYPDSDSEYYFNSNRATYVVKDTEVVRVEKERANRKRKETLRQQKITKTIMALPETMQVAETKNIKIVAEKRNLKVEGGILDKFLGGRSCPIKVYNFVIYNKPTYVRGPLDDNLWYADEKQMVKNDKFVANAGRWSDTFDSYIVKCESWNNPRRKTYYQLKKKKFAEDMVSAILMKKADRTKANIDTITLEATEIAGFARQKREKIITECDALQKNWSSEEDVTDF